MAGHRKRNRSNARLVEATKHGFENRAAPTLPVVSSAATPSPSTVLADRIALNPVGISRTGDSSKEGNSHRPSPPWYDVPRHVAIGSEALVKQVGLCRCG